MLKDKINGLIKSEKKLDNKRKIESLVVFVIVLIVTIIAINSIWNNDKKVVKDATNTYNKNLASSNSIPTTVQDPYNNDLKKNLESILSSINGVGKVSVFINYSESSTVEAMYNQTTKESSTEETDDSGGVRTIQQTDTQKDVVFSEDSGAKTPVTQKVINPTIEGAIITAQGAGDSNVKANITDAVSAATGLPTHKIQVFKMSN